MFEALEDRAEDWLLTARLERAGCLMAVERFEDGLTLYESLAPGPRGRLVHPGLGAVSRVIPYRSRRCSKARACASNSTAKC